MELLWKTFIWASLGLIGHLVRQSEGVTGPPAFDGLLENTTFPYMARLQNPYRQCTGTIIGQQWILTSLWCVEFGKNEIPEPWTHHR